MKKLLSLILILFTSDILHSQVAISYFPYPSYLSVSSNPKRTIWLDYKLETNTFFTNLNMEISPKVNIKNNPLISCYLGPGLSLNPVNYSSDLPILNGYFIDAGIRWSPLEKMKQVQLVFEVSPYLNHQFNSGNLRTRLGISYVFTQNRHVRQTK
jgi:hypothetical protein